MSSSFWPSTACSVYSPGFNCVCPTVVTARTEKVVELVPGAFLAAKTGDTRRSTASATNDLVARMRIFLGSSEYKGCPERVRRGRRPPGVDAARLQLA